MFGLVCFPGGPVNVYMYVFFIFCLLLEFESKVSASATTSTRSATTATAGSFGTTPSIGRLPATPCGKPATSSVFSSTQRQCHSLTVTTLSQASSWSRSIATESWWRAYPTPSPSTCSIRMKLISFFVLSLKPLCICIYVRVWP